MTLHIKTARDALGMSQKDLAQRMGLNQATVSLWEKGKTSPKGPALFFIEELLRGAGLNPEEFRAEDAPKPANQ